MIQRFGVLLIGSFLALGCSDDKTSGPTGGHDAGRDGQSRGDTRASGSDLANGGRRDSAVVVRQDDGGAADDFAWPQGDSGSQAKVDSGSQAKVDSGSQAKVDSGAISDSRPRSDLQVGTKNCMQLFECARVNNCQTLACIDTCRAEGCISAQTTAMTLRACALTKCTAECATYGSSCDACLQSQCANDLAACVANAC